MRPRFLKGLLVIASLLVGLAMAEALLSVVMRSETDFLSTSRPGFYCEDEVLGVSTVCPGRNAVMRVLGSNSFSRFSLNGAGYRGPYVTSPRASGNPPVDVVLVGGQSQGFGFGLDEQSTFSAVAARHTCVPTRFNNLAFVGFNNRVSWNIFRSRLSNTVREKYIIISVYWRAIWGEIEAADEEYRSWTREYTVVNDWMHKNFGLGRNLLTRSNLFVYISKHISKITLFQSAAKSDKKDDKYRPAVQRRNFVKFFSEIDAYAKSKGARLGLLLLPSYGGHVIDDAQIAATLPGDAFLIDASRLVKEAGLHTEVLQDGHYNAKQADLIGRLIADALNRQLGCAAGTTQRR